MKVENQNTPREYKAALPDNQNPQTTTKTWLSYVVEVATCGIFTKDSTQAMRKKETTQSVSSTYQNTLSQLNRVHQEQVASLIQEHESKKQALQKKHLKEVMTLEIDQDITIGRLLKEDQREPEKNIKGPFLSYVLLQHEETLNELKTKHNASIEHLEKDFKAKMAKIQSIYEDKIQCLCAEFMH